MTFYPREKDPLPRVQEPGRDTKPVWTGAENLSCTRTGPQGCPARSESLYRLRWMRICAYNGNVFHFIKNNSKSVNFALIWTGSSLSSPHTWSFKTRRVWECLHRNRGNEPTSDSHQYLFVCRIRRNSATEAHSVCPSWCVRPLGPLTRPHEPHCSHYCTGAFSCSITGVSNSPCLGLCPVHI